MGKSAKRQLQGARSLICDGLKLGEGHTLLLLYQEDLLNAAECIKEAAKGLEVKVDARGFNREAFFGSYPQAFSPDVLTTSTAKPSGIALLMEWSEATTKARLALLRDLQMQRQPWSIASMPGVDFDGLGSCLSDFPAITKNCNAAYAYLARTNLAILETWNHKGTMDKLVIPIGKYSPIISTGEIPLGTWGNFPSGETFIVPNKYCAEGWVTIRGSLPSHPLNDSEWIRCHIKNGRINYESIVASSRKLKQEFASLFFTLNGRIKNENTNALAELGIGTNPNIAHLTGKPIFDEKKLGTVHIAFGRNDQFGGPLKSSVHHDIVCTGATLKVRSVLSNGDSATDYTIVQKGTFQIDEATAVPMIDSFQEITLTSKKVRRGKAVFKINRGNLEADLPQMVIDYASPRSNPSFMIGVGKAATIANDILEEVTKKGSLSISQIVKTHSRTSDSHYCRQIISGLLEYGLLK